MNVKLFLGLRQPRPEQGRFGEGSQRSVVVNDVGSPSKQRRRHRCPKLPPLRLVRQALGWAWLLAAVPAATRGQVVYHNYETPSEIQADGDFDGDSRRDLIIVDRLTGDYRIGYQLAPGVVTWAPARASGIAGATGFGVGKLNSLGFDSLAFTGPDANRVNLLDANSPVSAGLPVSVFVPSLGPNVVVVMDIGGPTNTTHDDLYVASLYNGPPPYRETLLRNNATTNRTVLGDNSISFLRERGNPVLLHTNRPARLGCFERNIAVNQDRFRIFDLSSGVGSSNVASVTVARTPNPYEFLTAQFVGTNPYCQFLLYSPGGSNLFEFQVTEPSAGTYALALSNIFLWPNPIGQVFDLPGTNTHKLLVFDTNGTQAIIYNFNGLTTPVFLQQFAAPPGEHFTGAGVFGPSGFMAYTAPAGLSRSTSFRQWTWTGSSYSNTVSGTLPALSTYTAAANVMQFQFEPFVTNNPTLLRRNNSGDWASNPSFSGSPGNISVRTETFLGPAQGLGNPAIIPLGPAHPLAAFGLANQYSNMISLFSFNAPSGDSVSEVSISPPPGIYATSVQLAFASANSADRIFFRIAAGPWNTWSNGLKVILFTNSTVQYYGQPTNSPTKSLVKSAPYSFTQGPATLDSKGDGIPDYVKIARGLNLTGSRDSDGDGYSDLEELIHGKDPLSNSSVPTNFPHLDEQAVFDLNATPAPWDGFANATTLCATGTVMRAYDFQGSLLSFGSASTSSWPVVRLTNITIVAEDRLVPHATELHYDILTTNTDTKIGREMVGLAPLPPLTLPTVPYVYGGGNLATEANNWIAAASNIFNNLPRGQLTNALTIYDTLESLLFEKKTAQLLAARGYPGWSNLSLFPFRVADVGRSNPPAPTLLDLESATTNQPGYKLQTMFLTISNAVASANPAIASLRAVVQDIYRIDSLLNNSNPAKFASPVDEIRLFLWQGSLDSNYLAYATTAGQFPAASNGVQTVLDSVTARPTTNVYLVVRMDTLGGPCRILDLYGGGATFALQNSSGLPFSFPDNFQLLPGSIVQVTGYTDVTNTGCVYPAIEVTSALLSGVPIATDNDNDGNLLIDTWEKRFFGALGLADPFGDDDGDGYQNLQEMLEGSDPKDFYGRPLVPPASFGPPVLSLLNLGVSMELHFQWPAAYIGKFNFGVRHAPALTSPFTDLVVAGPFQVSGDQFKVVFLPPGTPEHYYYLTIALK